MSPDRRTALVRANFELKAKLAARLAAAQAVGPRRTAGDVAPGRGRRAWRRRRTVTPMSDPCAAGYRSDSAAPAELARRLRFNSSLL